MSTSVGTEVKNTNVHSTLVIDLIEWKGDRFGILVDSVSAMMTEMVGELGSGFPYVCLSTACAENSKDDVQELQKK